MVCAVLLTLSCMVHAQTSEGPQQPPPIVPQGPLDYVCPMDKDVRSDKPGECPRCHMKLVLGIPDDTEYPMELSINPPVFKPGQKVQITFRIVDPKNGKTVDHFKIVHDMLFHMFIISSDLDFFIHEHPVPQKDGTFKYDMIFPRSGMYRIAGDFYPSGGTPQIVARTIIVPGGETKLTDAVLKPQLEMSHCKNIDVELVMDPPQPIAGMKTLLFFKIKPADGLEQYLSAWGHMLAASDDLIDLIHDHPFIADGGPQEQFNIIFPRARTYRVWVQFQRKGVVNTAEFTIPVSELR